MIGTYKTKDFNMRDLAEIGKTLQNYKPDEIIIDDFAKNIINKVFDQLSLIFPAWKYNWKTDKTLNAAKMEWTKAFNESGINTLAQIKFGFAKARKHESDFLPSPGKFISWCKPSPEDFGYPDAHKAMRDCFEYQDSDRYFSNNGLGQKTVSKRPLIVDLCKKIDWFAFRRMESNQADKYFNDQYQSLINSGYVEPEPSFDDHQLPTPETVKAGMSEQQKADSKQRKMDMIKDIKNKLRGKA